MVVVRLSQNIDLAKCIRKNIARKAIVKDCLATYTFSSESEVKKTQTILIWSILTVAVLFDARSYRIPNQLIILGYLAGICLNLQAQGMIGITYFMMQAAWPILLLFPLYICGKQIGSGDIKLFSVMSTMVGFNITFSVMVGSVIVAAVVVVLVSIYERHLFRRKLHYSYYIAAAFFISQLRS